MAVVLQVIVSTFYDVIGYGGVCAWLTMPLFLLLSMLYFECDCISSLVFTISDPHGARYYLALV